jgi:hypothetical protein
MKNNIIVSLRLTLVCLVFFSGFYTFFVYGISKLVPAQVAFKKTSQDFMKTWVKVLLMINTFTLGHRQ